MKKIILLTTLLALVLPVAAEEVILLNQQNFQQEISKLFFREQQASAALASQQTPPENKHAANAKKPKHDFPTNLANKVQQAAASQATAAQSHGKQWQIAMFLAVENRPFAETMGTIKWLIRKGFLRRAAILRAADGTSNGDFYFLYQTPTGTKTEKLQRDSSLTAATLLSSLFSNMENGDSLYNAILLDAHGSGMEMSYANDSWLEVDDLLKALKKANLQTDILNLDSCHMGSFYTVYQIARYKNVKYLLASSDYMCGSERQMYYLLLQNLHLSPRLAAINTTRQMKNLFYSYPAEVVHNSLAIDMQQLYPVTEEWFKNYGAFMFSINNESKTQLNAPFAPHLGEVRSLHKIIRKQLEYLEGNGKELYNAWTSTCSFRPKYESFIQSSHKMVEALSKSVLEQWCYSQKLDKIFSNRIPPNIDCSDGISVTYEQLDYLLHKESKMLEKESVCPLQEKSKTQEEESSGGNKRIVG